CASEPARDARSRRKCSYIFEQNEKALLAAPRRLHGNDAQIDLARSGLAANADASAPHLGVARATFGNRAAQLEEQAFARHPEHVEARFARCGLEVRAGLAAELQHVEIVVDEHPRRGIAAEDCTVGLALPVDRCRLWFLVARAGQQTGAARFGGEVRIRASSTRLPAVDPMLAI